ncbi:chemotaxis protein MotB [Neolewinella xylanilytica]|uniref:Chemotaxis protein MotB n=1 Tax=Neolewinella xylanilytica TaxID=1514080 RepID=A0A2S6I5Y7_9BACT|nr:OmpA family protein [Neolewinella xylanilytica]PPK86521.1 chemotaxis protein MotB [Neolewinella xylanilytica]
MLKNSLLFLVLLLGLTSCVSKKKFESLQADVTSRDELIAQRDQELNRYAQQLAECERRELQLENELETANAQATLREEQVVDLREQRDRQLTQLEGLTNLSQGASQNISQTLSQLEGKDRYIRVLQAAKSRADSINLALAVNLKSVLRDGIEDEDVTIEVDKTVVYINLSDKMLYKSGSYQITDRAAEVLEKIASIAKSRPSLEIMVEGYTDNVPINTNCVKDNWDLSVLRATAVVKALENKFDIDPNRLIAAGRGEYNQLVDNTTAENRSINRRTRIILLPRLDQFYDLLDPTKVPE